MTLRLLPYGDGALLAEPADPALVLALADAAAAVDGVREVVPAARTVLLVLDGRASRAGVVEAVRAAAGRLDLRAAPASDEITLDVRYDGPDLADTASEVGLDADGLVRAHAAIVYTVAFCGFLPGFGYLTGLPARLQVGRLAAPRTRVPVGSVGIAGEFTGVYPRASPGGWRLLGRTDATLWDAERTPPALLQPGTRVRFRAVPAA